MKITIIQARMEYKEESGYIGNVEFEVENHKEPYEITLYSKKGKEWEYGLNFLREPGKEEEILAVEQYLEENDQAFDLLLDAAQNALQK